MYRKFSSILFKVGIAIGVIILLEEGFQALLFSHVQSFQNLRDPSLYGTAKDEDDYWKLHYWFSGGQTQSRASVHPLLGWTGDFSGETFKHHATSEIDNRVPVLLFGDAFTACKGLEKEECFEGIFNSDTTISHDYFLLNYGVSGYGLDQIFLLLQQSVDNYAEHLNDAPSNMEGPRRPFIIVSFFSETLDRSILTVSEAPKPYLHAGGKELAIRGTPLYPDPYKFYVEHPPSIVSYLYRLTENQVFPESPLHISEKTKAKAWGKIVINREILVEMIQELRERELPHLFLIFHLPKEVEEKHNDWHDQYIVTDVLRKHAVPFISSKAVIRKDSIVQNKEIDEYYLPDSHPNAEQISLIYKEIKNYILSNYDSRRPL